MILKKNNLLFYFPQSIISNSYEMNLQMSKHACSFALLTSDGTLNAFCLIKAPSSVENVYAIFFSL